MQLTSRCFAALCFVFHRQRRAVPTGKRLVKTCPCHTLSRITLKKGGGGREASAQRRGTERGGGGEAWRYCHPPRKCVLPLPSVRLLDVAPCRRASPRLHRADSTRSARSALPRTIHYDSCPPSFCERSIVPVGCWLAPLASVSGFRPSQL